MVIMSPTMVTPPLRGVGVVRMPPTVVSPSLGRVGVVRCPIGRVGVARHTSTQMSALLRGVGVVRMPPTATGMSDPFPGVGWVGVVPSSGVIMRGRVTAGRVGFRGHTVDC